jgi:secreted PhoX family phosphatase
VLDGDADGVGVLTCVFASPGDLQADHLDNLCRDREFAGVCFSPRGDFLFVNVQVPGVTFQIWGPWDA